MRFVILLSVLLSAFLAVAQDDLHCGTDAVMHDYYKKHPEAEQQKKILDQLRLQHRAGTMSTQTFTIPVVFHVLHMGGPENISDAQVKDALTILNRDYAKKNADTVFIIPEFRPIASSTGIHFELATIDPNGQCTNGIIHYYDADTDWFDASPTLYQYTWDPTKYMNVYVVKTITMSSGFGAAGYTYFPGSLNTGSPADAIVVLNNYFGSIGTGNAFLSRVLTHEVGHWLGLYHVFGYTNSAGVDCSGDDFINDTPPTPGYLSCPDASNSGLYQQCTPGVSENFQNYMDYSYCVKMFTQEQALVMQNTLITGIAGRDNLYSPANLLATGVTTSAVCIPIADFTYSRSRTCTGVPVVFQDASMNAAATSYTWSFPGGSPSSSNLQAPSVTYNAPGFYSVTYTSASSAGASGPVTKTNIIEVVNNAAAYQAPFTEGFENDPLPNTDWRVYNTSGGANWEQTFDAAYTGNFSAKLSSVNNTRLAKATMISPVIDLSAITSPQLIFKVATADLNSAHINTLSISASTDCEQTWTQVYSKTGQALVTAVAMQSPFIPAGISEWRIETVNLSALSNSAHAVFKFSYWRDTVAGASDVYIDDINITSSTGITEADLNSIFNVYPNPSNGIVFIECNANYVHTITITDLLGQVVDQISVKPEQATYRFYPETTGVYFISTESVTGKHTKKLVVQ